MSWGGRDKRATARSPEDPVDAAFFALRDQLSDTREALKEARAGAAKAEKATAAARKPRPPTPKEVYAQRSALVQPFVQAGYGVWTSLLAASMIPTRWMDFWNGEDVRFLTSQALIAICCAITMVTQYPKLVLGIWLWVFGALAVVLYSLGAL